LGFFLLKALGRDPRWSLIHDLEPIGWPHRSGSNGPTSGGVGEASESLPQLLYFDKGIVALVAIDGPGCEISGKGRKFRDRCRDGGKLDSLQRCDRPFGALLIGSRFHCVLLFWYVGSLAGISPGISLA
jgi:hypothetical protein